MTIDTAADSIAKVQGELATIDRIEAGFTELAKAHPADVAIDVTTGKGMKEAIAARAAWREPRIAVEKARKAAKDPVLKLGRAIDARAAELTERLLVGESNYDEQIKAEEARKEAERQAKIEAEAERIERIQDYLEAIREGVQDTLMAKSSAEVERDIAYFIETKTDKLERFEEFRPQVEELILATLKRMREILAEHVAREVEAERIAAERAELVRLRAEQEARDKAERERIESEQRAERERLAAERAELERQQAEASAAQQRADAEAAAARRAADEKAAADRAEADRVAREARQAEERQLAAERAELQRQRDEAAAAERRAREEREAVLRTEEQARMEQRQALEAAVMPMRDALVAVRDDTNVLLLTVDTRGAIERALLAAGLPTIADLADVPF